MSFLLGARTPGKRQTRPVVKAPADVRLTTPAGVAVVRRGVIHYANDYLCRMLGYSKEELAGLNVRELFADRDDSERLVRDIHRQVREHGAGTAETQWRRKDGESITVRLSAGLADPNGLDTCLSIVVTEIPESVRAQGTPGDVATLLGEAQEVFLSGPVVVFKWCKGEGWPVSYVTPNVEDMLGYTADDFVSGRVQYLDIIYEEDRKRVAEEVATHSAAATTTSFVHEPYRVTAKDGRVIWLADHTTICREPGGDITHYIGYVLDTSRTRQMEETLRQALAYGRQVISGIGQGVAVYDRDLAYLEWNPFMESLTSKSRDEMVGKHALDVFPHLRERGIDTLMCRALAGETVTSPEIAFTNPQTGRNYWLVNTYSPYLDRYGEIVGVVGLIHDVTDRVKAERALAESALLAKAIVHGSPIPQFIIDRDHKVTHWNAALEEITGAKAGDILGSDRHWQPFYPEERPTMADILVESTFDTIPTWYVGKYRKSRTVTGAYEATDYFPHLGPSGKWLHFTASAILDSEGQIIGAIETLQDITERKRAEDELLLKNRAVESSVNAVMINDLDGKTLYVNDSFLCIFGYSHEEAMHLTAFDLAGDSEVNESVFGVMQREGSFLGESVVKRKDGSCFPVQISASTITDAEGRPIATIGSFIDITTRKLAEAALAASEERYRNFVLNTSEGIFRIDFTQPIDVSKPYEQLVEDVTAYAVVGEANHAMAAMFGLKPEEMAGRPIREFDPACGIQTADLIMSPGCRVVDRVEEELNAKGETIYTVDSAFGTIESGFLKRVWGVQRDITEQKRAQQALKESEERYRRLINTAYEGVWVVDTDSNTTFVNARMAEMLGYAPEELIGRRFTEFLFPEDVPDHVRMMTLRSQGIPGRYERRLCRKNGDVLWTLISGAPLYDAQQQYVGSFGMIVDMTERKRAEAALAKSEGMMRSMLEASSVGIGMIVDRHMFAVNASLCRITGYSEAELVGRDTRMLYPDDEAYLCTGRNLHEQMEREGLGVQETRLRTKDGRPIDVILSLSPFNPADMEAGVTATVTDITERKRAEEEIRSAKAFLDMVIDMSPFAMWIADQDGTITRANRSLCETMNLSESAIVNKYNVLKDVNLETQGVMPEVKAVFEDHQFAHFIIPWKAARAGSGDFEGARDMHIDVSMFPILDAQGELTNVVCQWLDITERKRAEDALRVSEANLTTFFDTIEDLLFVVGADGRILRVNNTVSRRLGLGERELVGADFATLTPPELRHETIRMIDAMRSCDEAGNSLPILAIDGRQISVETKVVRGQWSGVPALFIVSRDITELKASEEKFSKSFQMNAALMAISTLGEGRYVDVNDTFLGALGYSRQEVIGRTAAELTVFADPAARGAVVHALESHQQVRGVEIGITKKDGTLLIGLFAADIIDIQGVPHLLTVMNDITERKHAEGKLLLNSRRVQALLGLNQMAHATLKEITSYALEEAVAITQSDIGYLAFLNDDESVLTMHSWSNKAMQQCAVIDKPIAYRVVETGLWGEAVRQRRAVITNDYAAPNAHKKGYPSGHVEVRRHMNVPIFAGNHIVLVIGVGNKESEYNETDVEQLTLLMEGMWRLVERLSTQEKLAKSEQRFRTLIENMQEGVALHEVVYNEQHQAIDYRVLDVNPAYERHTGINSEHARGRLATELYGVAAPPYLERWAEVAETGEPNVFETYFEPMQKHFRISAVSPSRGSFATVFQDITMQKQQDAAIREREEKLSSLFRSAPIGIGMIRGDREIVEANDELCRMTGYSREELIGQNARLLYANQEEYDFVGREKYRQIAEYGTGTLETNWRRKDGSIIHIVLGSSPLDRADLTKGLTFTGLDITDRIRAEEAVREKAEELDRYFTSAIDLLCIADTDGRFRRLNKEWEHVLGYPLSELEGTLFVDLVHPDDREATRMSILQLSAQPEVTSFTNRYRCKDGSYRWIEWRSIPSGDLIYACARDITERTRAEQALVESEHRFRLVGEQTGQIVYDWDMATGNIKWIGSVERITGFTADEYQQVNIARWAQMVHPDDRRAGTGAFHEAATPGGPHPAEYRLQRKDGSYVYVEDNGVFLRNDRGEPYRMIGTMKDISERKKAQEDRECLIRELEGKNAELERFAYTVSHDLKAPLITISGFIGLLKQHVGAGAVDRVNSDMDRISNAANKMSGLLDSLLEVSRIGRIVNPSEAVSMTDLTLEAAEMLASHIGARGVEIRVPNGLPAVFGDRARLLEVLQNLIDNAVKYMGDQAAPWVEIGCEDQAGETVFHVRDNGIGIQPRFHERVFDLFRQLDPGVDGSGVGLALVKRIVEYHGGRIWVESEGANRGSTFYFTLPGVPSQEQLTRSGSAAETVPDHVG